MGKEHRKKMKGVNHWVLKNGWQARTLAWRSKISKGNDWGRRMLSSFIPRKSITRKSFTSMKILSLAKVRIATHTALCVGVYLSVIETTFWRNSEAENFPMMKNFSGENLGSFLPRKLDCHMRCSSLEVLTVIRSVTCRPGSFWEGSPAEACDSRTCFTC